MAPRTLHHADILAPGAQVRITRAALRPVRPKALHDHDFYELFWVQNGQVRHHRPGGAETLTEGDLVALSPGQTHGLQGRGEHAIVVSLCLHPDLIAGLAQRHPVLSSVFGGAEPFGATRDIRQMAALNHAALQLEASDGGQLPAEAFLLPLLSDLATEAARVPAGVPGWLRDACLAAHAPEVFREGAAGLVAQTGYAHAHVARSMRRYLDQTPSDYVNAIRMDHAARALTTDAEPLAEIAEACGIPNLSHFHKLFRARHGITPLKYRQRFQRDVLQPGS